MKLLVVDNYDSFTYNLVQIIEQNKNCFYEVRKNDQVDLDRAEVYDKILFSPGPGLPGEVSIMGEIIKKYASGKSILGVCLGHQAIACSFGCRLYNLQQVRHGIKVKMRISAKSDYLFHGLPEEIDAGLYHSWAVDKESLPSCLEATAMSDEGVVMAISHKEYDLKGIQFHPESIMTLYGEKIIQNWLEGPF